MVEIFDDVSSVEELIQKYDKVFLYGAGASCRLLIASFGDDVLKGHVECIIDANSKLSGNMISVGGDDIDIIDIESYATKYGPSGTGNVLLLTPAFSSLIIERLDEIPFFDGAKVYLLPMLCHRQDAGEYNLRSEDRPLIPKIIHYFWIGGGTMPEEYRKNIEGWKRLNPDYEIRCWNEDNYDINSIPYMSEAYHAGKEYLMFATDYARMDVLYRYGGIYLDTDVELMRPLDDLLFNKGFVGEEENGQINSGSGIGAMPAHPMIKKLMMCYRDRHFLSDDGRPQRSYNTYYETKCFIDSGYKMTNAYQRVCDMVCFPREVLMPICFAGMSDCYSKHTVSVHRINPEHHMMHRTAFEKWAERVIE